ncbi:MAG TPA: TetR/AcrR family transcriptional regulator [Burkholderiaceae bacterium]|nr:TetR/AcrR family transcriptional regulator [Burkholderiaceae bacterium]
MQLLDEGDLASLTTNAVAARAGVSIGTLYQYFDGKTALLDALVARELGAMSEKVIAAVQGAPPAAPGERIRQIVRAVTGAYGGRGRVHRSLIEHALSQGPGRRLSPLYARLIVLFTSDGLPGPGRAARRLTPAQAFVLTHAMAGVLRALAASDRPPPRAEVEDALVRLVGAYIAAAQRGPATAAAPLPAKSARASGA